MLGHYSRERGLFPLAEAVLWMTRQPTDVCRLAGRGRLVPGAFADLAVLDPAVVAVRGLP